MLCAETWCTFPPANICSTESVTIPFLFLFNKVRKVKQYWNGYLFMIPQYINTIYSNVNIMLKTVPSKVDLHNKQFTILYERNIRRIHTLKNIVEYNLQWAIFQVRVIFILGKWQQDNINAGLGSQIADISGNIISSCSFILISNGVSLFDRWDYQEGRVYTIYCWNVGPPREVCSRQVPRTLGENLAYAYSRLC